MSDQPEALRLIDTFVSRRDLAWHCSATAELRRLHEENERLREQLRLANIDALNEAAENDSLDRENERLRAALLRIRETKVFLGAIAQEMMDAALRREEAK